MMQTFVDELVGGLTEMVRLGERLPDEVFRLGAGDLERVLPLLDRCRAVAEAGVFTLTREAQVRGEVEASQAGSTAQWLAARAPSLDPRTAGAVAKAVRELAPVCLAPVRDAVAAGRLSPVVGSVVASEFRQLRGQLAEGADEAVLAGLVEMGETHGAAGVRGLRPALLARYGLGRLHQVSDERASALTSLSAGRDLGGGLTEYFLRLSPEGRAALEAAIGPLSAPTPTEGMPDPRPVAQRRGDALVAVCRKASEVSPSSTPSGVKATVFVTVGLDDLKDLTRAGSLFGGLDTGTLLGPDTIRRIGCDGSIAPVVLDTDGTCLGVGPVRRLFSPTQVRALWRRDRRCTFPGCTAPAQWTDAHHIRHWADGGPTELWNAALLCGRHHTIVHRDRLVATVTNDQVAWDLVPGSYDRSLARQSDLRPAVRESRVQRAADHEGLARGDPDPP